MSGPALIVRVDALREIAFGSITGSFAVFGAKFAHATRIVKIINTCNTGMFISFDGTTTNDYVPGGGFVLYDLTTNGIGQEFVFQIGTQVYVKYESAPASGNVYVSCIYGQGQ
jgi:hypothetical protein